MSGWTTAGEKLKQQRAEQQRNAEGRFASTASNPFEKDRRGHRNVSAINRMMRTNPSLAKRLCEQAGQRWTDWADCRPHVQGDLGRDLSLGRSR